MRNQIGVALSAIIAFCAAAAAPQGQPTTSPTTKPSSEPTEVFASVEKILATVPADILPDAPDRWTDIAIESANKVLDSRVAEHEAYAKFMLLKATEMKELFLLTGMAKIGNQYVQVFGAFTKSDENRAILARLQAGKFITLHGTVRAIAFVRLKDNPYDVHLTMLLKGEDVVGSKRDEN